MSSLLGNLLMETCTLPGTASVITLAGAPTGRRPFSSRFTNGQSCWYFMFDGDRAEAAKGTYGSGPPSTLTRPASVTWNSDGSTSRINFPGQTYVICEPPAEAWVTTDDFTETTGVTRGWMRWPNKKIFQYGYEVTPANSGVKRVDFPIPFPTALLTMIPVPVLTGYYPLATVVGDRDRTYSNVLAINMQAGSAYTTGGMYFYWFAIGE